LDEQELINTEVDLQIIYDIESGDFSSPEAKEVLLTLEKKRR